MLWQVIKNEIFTPDCSGPWLIMTISIAGGQQGVSKTVYLSAKDNIRRKEEGTRREGKAGV